MIFSELIIQNELINSFRNKLFLLINQLIKKIKKGKKRVLNFFPRLHFFLISADSEIVTLGNTLGQFDPCTDFVKEYFKISFKTGRRLAIFL